MAWEDHDTTIRKALVAWTFFKMCGYAAEHLYFSTRRHALGCEIDIVVKKPHLPQFCLCAGRAPYDNASAQRRWKKICEDAARNDGSALVEDCQRAMMDPEIVVVLTDSLFKMQELGLPTAPEQHIQGDPS